MKRFLVFTLLALFLGGSVSVTFAAGLSAGTSQTSYKEKLSAKYGRKPVVAVNRATPTWSRVAPTWRNFTVLNVNTPRYQVQSRTA